MTKRILHLSKLLIFLWLSSLAASAFGRPSDGGDDSCNLPAPDNFHVASSTATSVTLAWDPVAGASAYYIVALDHYTQQILDDEVITSNIPILYVPAGSTVDLRVHAICNNQETSPIYREIQGFTLIITEFVVEVNAPCAPPNMPANGMGSGGVQVQWSSDVTYWIDVTRVSTGEISRYGLHLTKDGSSKHLVIGKTPVPANGYDDWPSSGAALFPNGTLDPPFAADFDRIQISNEAEGRIFPVFWIDFAEACLQSCLTLSFTQINTDYQVKVSDPEYCGNGAGNSGASPRNSAGNATHFFIQTPFTTALRLGNIQPRAEQLRFTLFDLNGRPLLDRQYPADVAYELPTAALPPGFYLLRIENGALAETYKVIKSR